MMMKVSTLAVLLAVNLIPLTAAGAAEYGTCKFNSATLRFAGSVEQTVGCLLKKVRERGSGADAKPIPDWLLQRVVRPVGFTPKQLAAYLTREHIDVAALSGTLTLGDTPHVRYFVIHDTSSPETETASTTFPPNINEASWPGNGLGGWAGVARKVNLIISRDGRSRALQPWGTARTSPATKLEQTNFVPAARRVFVHVENIQPRLKSPGSWGWRAPMPGFGPAQEKRLALAYMVASLRAGRWLIPAYHFNIDAGLSTDAHDDPQHADLASWVTQLDALESDVLANGH